MTMGNCRLEKWCCTVFVIMSISTPIALTLGGIHQNLMSQVLIIWVENCTICAIRYRKLQWVVLSLRTLSVWSFKWKHACYCWTLKREQKKYREWFCVKWIRLWVEVSSLNGVKKSSRSVAMLFLCLIFQCKLTWRFAKDHSRALQWPVL